MNELDRDRFEQLVALADAYLMGELDAAGLAALEQMVCEDSAAAQALAQYLRQAGALREGLAESAKAERESSEPELGEYLSILSDLGGGEVQAVDLTDELARRKEAQLERDRRRFAVVDADPPVARVIVIPRPLVWLAGAAAVLLLALVFWPAPTPPPDHADTQDPAPSATTPAPAVGRVVSSVDARWESPLETAGVLRAGQTLTLTQGLVQITFNDGAHVILEAPATLEPTGTNGLRLASGKLTANIPASAHGFTVVTASGLITDYGTEFGVHVNHDGQTLAHTFTGRIGLTPVGGGEEVQLLADDAIVADTSGRIREVETPAFTFVRGDEFVVRQVAAGPHASPYHRWLAHSYDLRRDADVVLYYTFGNAEVSGQTLRNRAGGQGARQYDASFVADPTSPGRFDEKPAFGFDDDGDFVEATMDRVMPAATLAGWYWIDEIDGTFASLLHTSGMANPGGIHWHVNTNHGAGWAIEFVQNRTRNLQPGYWHDLLSTDWQPQSLTGRWVHLALCYDSTAGDAVLYVDGREAQRSQIDDGVPIKLGRFRLGNWDAPEREGTSDWPRPLRGRVDEFVVFERALSGAEVAAMYDAGRPDN